MTMVERKKCVFLCLAQGMTCLAKLGVAEDKDRGRVSYNVVDTQAASPCRFTLCRRRVR